MAVSLIENQLNSIRRRRRSSDHNLTIKRLSHPRKVGNSISSIKGNTKGSTPDINLPLPISRVALLNRLKTFSPLSWTIHEPLLSPLVCAVQGWKCHESQNRKNELHCAGCHALLMVKLPNLEDQQSVIDVSDDELGVSIGYGAVEDLFFHQDEIMALDDDNTSDLMSLTEDVTHSSFQTTLVKSYLKRLQSEHYPACPFLPLLPLKPDDQDYYITPKDIPREILSFASRLETLQGNIDLLKDVKLHQLPINDEDMEWINKYIKIRHQQSKSLLISLLGWSLKIQQFSKDTILLLRCDYCSRRVLLSSSYHGHGIDQLPPCPYPVSISNNTTELEYGEGGIWEKEEEDSDITRLDLLTEHEGWCCMPSGWNLVLNGLKADIQNEQMSG